MTEIIRRSSLADELAQSVLELIRRQGYAPGQRLPSAKELAERFGVATPTMREALKYLQTLGAVEMRHGSGTYVGSQERLFLGNPMLERIGDQVLEDLIEARLAIETAAVRLAATRASPADLNKLRSLLETAAANLYDDAVLHDANMAFHRGIAEASGNVVYAQLMGILVGLFRREQELILEIYNAREQDLSEHRGIYQALAAGDPKAAAQHMRSHLEGVARVIASRRRKQ